MSETVYIDARPAIEAMMKESQDEMQDVFGSGEFVGDSWKHCIWRNIPNDEMVKLVKAVRNHHAIMGSRWNGKPLDTERWRQNDDGTWDYESVYAAGPDGPYGIEDWDGIVLIGPNRRELRCKYPVGTYVNYADGHGGDHVGTILRHSRKTMTIGIDGSNRYWRIPWAVVELAIIDIL